MKNATRRRQKSLRKGREQHLAHEDLPPSDKCAHPENAYFSSEDVSYFVTFHALKYRCFIDYLIEYLLRRHFYFYIYDMIYLLTAIGLSPSGSSTVHIYTQTIHRTIQNKKYIEQHNNFGRVRAVPRLG